MAIDTGKRSRARVADLPSAIPSVPVFEGEENFNADQEGKAFLKSLSDAVAEENWKAFGELFSDDCFWRDCLSLTFDKRTLPGRSTIVEAWKSLSSTRKPTNFTSDEGQTLSMTPQFVRLAPTMASLDIPFGFSTDAPKSKCVGLAKLVPQEGMWKIWILSTAVVSLEDHPFESLPRRSPSLIAGSQRGKTQPQGLPNVSGALDAVVIGGSDSGLANTIMLDAIGANVAVFDMEAVPGGNWSTQRYEDVMLHHPAAMVQLPMFPISSEQYPNYLSGHEVTKYFSAAVETLQLPFFGGIKVVSNTWNDSTKLWKVQLQDLKTGDTTMIETKNLVLSTGFLLGPGNPKYPEVANQDLFKGPVQHTSEYRNAEAYKDKDVVIVGSGTSAHDVARNLVLGGAKSVTILQRSPTVLFDFEVINPMVTMRYQGQMPVETADFLECATPVGILRDMSKGAVQMMLQAQSERSAAFESKGYLLDKSPCLISRAYEERGRSLYMDQLKVLDLVLGDKIKIARGELKEFLEDGIIVHDKTQGEDKTIKASGVILATGYKTIDLPKQYAQSGFIDPESASKLENVSCFGVDSEGEIPGNVTFSGRK